MPHQTVNIMRGVLPLADSKHTPIEQNRYTYNPTFWINGELPAINAENLNNIDSGINELSNKVIELDTRVHNLDGDIWNNDTQADGKVPLLQQDVQSLQLDVNNIETAVENINQIIGDWTLQNSIVETVGENIADISTLEAQNSAQQELIDSNTTNIEVNSASIEELNKAVGLTDDTDASLTERMSAAEDDIGTIETSVDAVEAIVGDGSYGSPTNNDGKADLTYAIRELERIVGEGIHDVADGTLAETLTQAIEDLKQQVIESTLVWHYF